MSLYSSSFGVNGSRWNLASVGWLNDEWLWGLTRAWCWVYQQCFQVAHFWHVIENPGALRDVILGIDLGHLCSHSLSNRVLMLLQVWVERAAWLVDLHSLYKRTSCRKVPDDQQWWTPWKLQQRGQEYTFTWQITQQGWVLDCLMSAESKFWEGSGVDIAERPPKACSFSFAHKVKIFLQPNKMALLNGCGWI